MTLAKVANAVAGVAGNVVHTSDTGSGDVWALEHDDPLASITYDDTYAVHSLTHGYKVDPGAGTSHATYRGWSPVTAAPVKTIYVRGYIRMPVYPTVRFSLHQIKLGTTRVADFGVTASNATTPNSVFDLRAADGSTVLATFTTPISKTGLVRYAFQIVQGTTSTFAAQMYQGANVESASPTYTDHIAPVSSTNLGSTLDTVVIGNCSNNNFGNPFWFFNVAVSVDADPGPYSGGESSAVALPPETSTVTGVGGFVLNGALIPFSSGTAVVGSSGVPSDLAAETNARTLLAAGVPNESKRIVALRRWWADLGNRDNQSALCVVVGTSISEGQGAADTAHRWINRCQAQLRRNFPTTGVLYGGGFIPPYYSSALTADVSLSGAPTNRQDVGLGMRGLDTTSSQVATFTSMPMTSFRVHWQESTLGQNITPQIDGVNQTAISTFGATGVNHITSYPTTATSHVIKIAGPASFNGLWGGCEFFNGDEARGVHVYDASHAGMNASLTITTYVQGHWPMVGLLNPGLVIFELGVNDSIFGGITAALFYTYMLTALGLLRAQCPTASVVFVGDYEQNNTLVEPWANYVNALYAVAATDPGCCVLDLNQRMPKVADSPNFGLYADIVHPSVQGHGFMADMVAGFISPPA